MLLGHAILINIYRVYLILLDRPISFLELPLAVFDVYASGGVCTSTLEEFEEGWTISILLVPPMIPYRHIMSFGSLPSDTQVA